MKKTEEIKKALENLLKSEQDNLERVKVRDLEESQRSSSGDLSSYDNHPAELGSETYDREMSITLMDRLAIHIVRIKRAIQKIDEGSYGRCDECGEKIASGRLKALPEATLCIKCQSQADKNYASKEIENKVFPYDPEFQSEMPEGT